MNISNAKLRRILRAIHLVGMVPLGLLLYTGAGENTVLTQVVQVVIFPTFLMTGIIMWQMPRLSKLLKRKR